MTPASFSPLERSPGLNLIARIATKIGTDAFAIAATPESMCFSPQAISVNGSAPLIVPKISPSRQVLRTPASAGRDALADCKEGEQQQPGDQQPQLDEDARREVADADLDEEVRGAPDRRRGRAGAGRRSASSLVRVTQTRVVPLPGYDGRLTQVAEQPLHRALGLTDGELDRICELLGREPNHFELAVFSLLWSEHCGYKHSALLLKRFPSGGERVLQGPGENAGVIDLGGGEAVAFKVESHNHPSAVEPFQGAATGVGGILRDIVAMGARPIALLDGLRFGAPDHHFDRAVAGIGAYGNSVGVPTVGGEAVFDPAYADNCLVNAMCVGLLPSDRVTRAGARTPGHLLVLYGATTGRDGIGGASVLASQELGEGAAEKRPSVQIGDPFTGKKLIEVSVELVERGLVESLQDCGAAGLASALAEMARDGAGVDVHLDRVPLREELEPWEIMISESQERMVAVVRPGFLEAVEEVCARWELHCTPIGEVTDTGELRAFHSGETLGEIPAHLLTDEAPRYRVEPRPRTPLALAPDPPPRPARAARLAERPQPRLDLRALRPPGRLADRAPPGSGRRGAAAPALDARARGVTGRACAGRCPVAAPGGRAGCPGGCAQCRVRRRGAPGPDRLPQLRQPGEAGGRLGARGGDRGDGTRGGGARSARSSPETSRSTTRQTGVRSRRRRSSAASASCGT